MLIQVLNYEKTACIFVIHILDRIFYYFHGLLFCIVTVLVRTFWKEGKIDGAIDAVRNMEQRGVVGNGGVYYELACGLCNNGRWKDAILEVCSLSLLYLGWSSGSNDLEFWSICGFFLFMYSCGLQNINNSFNMLSAILLNRLSVCLMEQLFQAMTGLSTRTALYGKTIL